MNPQKLSPLNIVFVILVVIGAVVMFSGVLSNRYKPNEDLAIPSGPAATPAAFINFDPPSGSYY